LNKWILVAVVLLLGFLASRMMCKTEPAFDLRGFEKKVSKLSRAAQLSKKIADKGQVPDYLKVDLGYLADVGGILERGEGECEDVADAIRVRHQRYRSEMDNLTGAPTVEDIRQMSRFRQREEGMRVIGHLAPAWAGLLEPVREFCDRCPEESEVLTKALGTAKAE
jgi:hypothetical protein